MNPFDQFDGAAVAANPFDQFDGAPTPAAGPSFAERAPVRAARVTADGFTRGVSDLLGLPVDIATAILNTGAAGIDMIPGVDVGRVQNPVGGSDFIYDAITAPGNVAVEAVTGTDPTIKPEGWAENLLYGAGRGMGDAALPVAGALATADRATDLAVPAGNWLKQLFRDMQRGAKVNPTGFTSREMGTAAAVGAGVQGGAYAADDGDPNTTTFAEALAPLLGGTAAGVGVATGGAVVRGGNELARSITGNPEYATDGAKEAITRYLGERAGAPIDPNGALNTDPVAQRILNGPDISRVVPDYQPTLAERLPDANIRAAEYSRQTGPNSGEFTNRREQNANAVAEAMDARQPGGDPALFRRNLDDSIATELQTRVEAAEAAQRALDEATDAVRPTGTAQTRGSDIRAGLVQARDKAMEEVNAIFAAVDGQDIQVDLGPLRQRFDNIVAALPENDRRRFQPPEVGTARVLAPDQESVDTGLVDFQGRPIMRDPPSPVGSLNEVTSIRSGLSSDIRSANTTDQQRRVSSQFRSETDQFLDDLVRDAESGLTPEARDALTEGQRRRLDVGRRFETPGTAINDALATTERGEFRADPAAIPGRFVQPDTGRTKDFGLLLREAGDNPQVREALADQVLSDAQPFLGRPEALRKFLSDRNIILSQFPELRTKLGGVADATDMARTARTESDEALRTLQPGGRSPEGQYTRFGPEDSLNSMRTVVNSDRPAEAVDALLARAGDTPENRAGLKQAFWQVLEDRARPVTASNRTGAGEDTWNFTKLYKALEDPKMSAAAERLYSDAPEHLADLRAIATELRRADPALTAKARGSSGTPQGAQTGREAMLDAATPNTETLGAYAFAYQRGQVGLAFIATRLGAVAARRLRRTAVERQMDAVLDRALLDPNYAATLMREYNPANMRAFVESSKAKGIVLAPEFVDALDAAAQDGGDDEVMDAIIGGER